MSKILFVKNNDDVFKAKPLDKKEDGTSIENQDEFDEIECRKNQDIE